MRILQWGAVALCLCLAGITSQVHAASLADHDDEAIAPFLWDWMDPVSFTEEGLQKIASKKDPLRPFFLAYRLLVQHQRTGDAEALKRAKRALDFMVEEYQPADRNPQGFRWFYGFDYDGGIKAPWWSGMDGFFGPMTLYAGWQATGDDHFKEIALRSAKRMLKDPTQGGVLWRNGDACWISEYSWNGMSQAQEFYVLNGHLWGLQALYMLGEASQDEELKEAYQCAKKGTIERLDKYYNATGTWTWYQLSRKVINPTHYNIIEQAQFNAMAKITGDEAYAEPAKRRGEIFKRAYPLSLVPVGEGFEIQFSMMGTPNSYWTDTYPVTVRCQVEGKTIEAQNASVYDKSVPLSQRLVLRMPVPSVPSSCTVSIHSNVEVKLYEQDKFDEVVSRRDKIPLKASADLRAQETSSPATFSLEPGGEPSLWSKIMGKVTSAPQGESRISIDVDRNLGPSDTLALIIHPDEKIQLGTIFVDDGDRTAFRYYPNLEAGIDNIVVLSALGFDRGDLLSEKIKQLTFRFYTRSTTNDFNVTLNDVEVLRTPDAVRQYMSEHEGAHFPQQ